MKVYKNSDTGEGVKIGKGMAAWMREVDADGNALVVIASVKEMNDGVHGNCVYNSVKRAHGAKKERWAACEGVWMEKRDLASLDAVGSNFIGYAADMAGSRSEIDRPWKDPLKGGDLRKWQEWWTTQSNVTGWSLKERVNAEDRYGDRRDGHIEAIAQHKGMSQIKVRFDKRRAKYDEIFDGTSTEVVKAPPTPAPELGVDMEEEPVDVCKLDSGTAKPRACATYWAVQLYVQGDLYDNRMAVLMTLVKDVDQVDPFFGTIVDFPNGIKLSNFPGLDWLEFLPPLGAGTYFSFSNLENGMEKTLGAVRTSIAKYGKLLGNQEEHEEGAKRCEKIVLNGPPSFAGLSIPETEMKLDEMSGPLEFMVDLVQPGTVLTFAAHIDPRRADYKVAFGFKGGFKTDWDDVVQVENAEFTAVVTHALKAAQSGGNVKDQIYQGPLEPGCECGAKEEDCADKVPTDNTTKPEKSCYHLEINLFGTGELHFEVANDPVAMKLHLSLNVFTHPETGSWVFDVTGTASLRIWGAAATLYFNYDPLQDLIVVAFKLNNLDFTKLPLIRDIEGAEEFSLVLTTLVVYFANQDQSHGGHTFKAGVTFAGQVDISSQEKPGFLVEIDDYFDVNLQQAHVTGWIPLPPISVKFGGPKEEPAESTEPQKAVAWPESFAINMGIAGKLSLTLGDLTTDFSDPALTFYQVGVPDPKNTAEMVKQSVLEMRLSGAMHIKGGAHTGGPHGLALVAG
jgi:hypothetical protein